MDPASLYGPAGGAQSVFGAANNTRIEGARLVIEILADQDGERAVGLQQRSDPLNERIAVAQFAAAQHQKTGVEPARQRLNESWRIKQQPPPVDTETVSCDA